MQEEERNEVAQKVIGAAFKVSNTLGCGFLEKVYENALAHELRKNGLRVVQQHPVPVWYDGALVGDFYADLLVDEEVLIELKAVDACGDAHTAQCLNYLKATGLTLCLLMNFGKPKLELKRLRRQAFGLLGFYLICVHLWLILMDTPVQAVKRPILCNPYEEPGPLAVSRLPRPAPAGTGVGRPARRGGEVSVVRPTPAVFTPMKDEARTPVGFLMENLPVAQSATGLGGQPARAF